MRQIHLNNVVIGEGKPKICIPVVANTIDEVNKQIQDIVKFPVELIELRGDYLDNYLDANEVVKAIKEIKKAADIPVIFTFRTSGEGGEKDISSAEYARLLKEVLISGAADVVDIELFLGDEFVSDLIEFAHKCGTNVILSNHDFENTPLKIEIITRIVKMQSLGADIAKIAVMPNSKEDVLTLLEATLLAKEQYMDIPIITMSMAENGVISRMAGEIFGSSVTFGAAGKASAPGQIPADSLAAVLDIIHTQYGKDNF